MWRRNSSPIVCITIHEPTFFFYLTRFHDLRWPQTQQCVVDENLVSGVHLYLWEHDNKLSLLLNYPSHCHTSFPQTVWRNLVKVETASFSVYTPLLSQHLIRFCVCPLSVTLFEGRRERELDSISCQCLPACLTNYSCLYSFFRLRSSVSPSLSLSLSVSPSLPPSLSLSPSLRPSLPPSLPLSYHRNMWIVGSKSSSEGLHDWNKLGILYRRNTVPNNERKGDINWLFTVFVCCCVFPRCLTFL